MSSKGQPEKYGVPWTRDELILAFDLYCRIPFKKTKANNPSVIELARLLQRTPASVARKLGNLGSFDPELQKRQVSGLSHASKLDETIWCEFQNDWNRLVIESRRLREKYDADSGFADDAATLERPRGASEKEVIRKSRIHQAFFREAVLSSYEESCCITGLKISECLVASHIVPWSVAEEFRTDPRNGLCLSATFDRLFDRGLITLSDSLDVVVASDLRQSNDKRTQEMISPYHGAAMIRPRRFLPLPDHLEWHRTHVFRG